MGIVFVKVDYIRLLANVAIFWKRHRKEAYHAA
jgi:hypothetical protein